MSDNFVNFKERVEKQFLKLQELNKKVNSILISSKKNIIFNGQCELSFIERIQENEKDISVHLEKIKRRQMKCVFFGQTSNGKSATINAILGREALPSSDGRTTSCFITIDSCDEDPYFIINGHKEYDINKLIDTANEICDSHITINNRIELFWPFYECNLLNENVQLLDSPGVDYSKDNDKWIETYCLDSDIFVYIVNSQATINESERGFFRKVTKFIKNPNIFVVWNKWDLCDIPKNEKKIAQIKEQHIDTTKEFFYKDLKLQCDARSKTFFLSAKEKLENGDKRSHKDVRVTKRLEDFDRFLETLSDEMSKNAIVNKFKPHIDSGSEYVIDIENVLKQFKNILKTDMHRTKRGIQELTDEINKYISEIFLKSIKDGESEIKRESPKIANVLMSNNQQDNSVSEFIRDKIIQSLLVTFNENIDELRVKMKSLFSSSSEFKLKDDALNKYIPKSFADHVPRLEKVMASNLRKGDSEVQEDYATKANEMNKSGETRGYVSALAEAAGNGAMFLMLRHPISAALIFMASNVLNKSTELMSESSRNQTRERLQQSSEDILMKYMKDSYGQYQRDIENDVCTYVTTFYEDHEHARDIMKEVNGLKSACEQLSENLLSELAMIMSLE